MTTREPIGSTLTSSSPLTRSYQVDNIAKHSRPHPKVRQFQWRKQCQEHELQVPFRPTVFPESLYPLSM